jgi:uncharacterized protein (TIRG00374 family)
MKGLKKFLVFALRFCISIILLVALFFFKDINVKELLFDIKTADKLLLFLAFVVFFLVYFLGLLRWYMLLKAADVRIPFKRVFTSFCGGVFFSCLLPSSIGGDLVRSIDLSKYTQKPKEVVATVLLDRLSGCVGLVIVMLVALICGWDLLGQNTAVLVSITLISGIMAVLLLVLFNKFIFTRINKLLHFPNAGRIREGLRNLFHELHYFRKHRKVLFYNLIISIIIQAIGPVVFYVTALSLGLRGMNPVYFFVFIPIIGAITLLPISIGGLGIRESMAALFLPAAGIAARDAAAFALINSFFILLYGAIGGLIYVLTVHHRRV